MACTHQLVANCGHLKLNLVSCPEIILIADGNEVSRAAAHGREEIAVDPLFIWVTLDDDIIVSVGILHCNLHGPVG